MNIIGHNKIGQDDLSENEMMDKVDDLLTRGHTVTYIARYLARAGYRNQRGNPISPYSLRYRLGDRERRAEARGATGRARIKAGPILYGWTWNGKKLIPQQEERKLLAILQKERAQKRGWESIARLLNENGYKNRRGDAITAAALKWLYKKHFGVFLVLLGGVTAHALYDLYVFIQ